jgi:acyl carrier protein
VPAGSAAPQQEGAAASERAALPDPTAAAQASIRARVVEIVAEQLGVEKRLLSDGTRFIQDLGADSLDTVELVMEFEDEFHLNFPDEDCERVSSVGDVVSYLHSIIVKRRAGSTG